MNTLAEVFAPGETLKEELAARGWTQKHFAQVLGRPARLVNELVNGKKRLTAETALQLEAALGTAAEFWLNLESQYQLFRARRALPETALAPEKPRSEPCQP